MFDTRVSNLKVGQEEVQWLDGRSSDKQKHQEMEDDEQP
jgi:hypothetical protein